MKDMNSLSGIRVAHKGLHDMDAGIPENTIIAIEKAVQKNYPIEIDIHLTKDKKIVVMHDDNLLEMIGVDKKIKNMTYEEMSKYNIKNSNQKIPLLEDVLNIVQGKVLIIIELKTYYNIGPLERELVKVLREYKGEVAVQSFNPFCLAWFKKNSPEYMRGLLSSDFTFQRYSFVKRVILKNLWFSWVGKPDFVAYEISALNEKLVSKIRKMEAKVIGWTIDDEEKAQKAEKLCDGIIFEKIDKYLKV